MPPTYKPRPFKPLGPPKDSVTFQISPDHRQLLLGMATLHGVSVSNVLSALWILTAASPPAEPLPPQSLRRRNELPRGVRYQPVTARPTEAMAAASILLVPGVFINTGRLTSWALDHHASLVADYYASPEDAATLRKEVVEAARALIPLPQPEPAEVEPPIVHDPRLSLPVEGPCPACPPDAPTATCGLCGGTGKIKRTMREWCALRGLKLKARRAA